MALLNAKRADGLTVEVFSAKRLGELKSHGKIMLIDDATVVVGSLALAALSLDFRREVAIVVDEPSAVAEAVELFRDAARSGGRDAARRAALGDGAVLIDRLVLGRDRVAAAPATRPPTAVDGRRPPSSQQEAKPAEGPSKPKKAKKKKAPKGNDEPAPDEADRSGRRAERAGRAAGASRWKQHPSMRYGDVFRLDGEAKFQEDAPLRPYAAGRRTARPVGAAPQPHRHQGQPVQAHRVRGRARAHREGADREGHRCSGVTPKSQWKDVNVNLTYMKNAQVQVGKFKVPFGLDQLTGVTHNDFVYRSLGANYLAPARDIGVHGARPLLQARPELLGRRVPARRRQRAVEEDPGRRRDVRRRASPARRSGS